MAPRVEFKRSLFGRYKVGYDCPRCASRLVSPLKQAGQPDFCPDCGIAFRVPGVDRLKAMNEAKAADEKRRAQLQQESRDKRRLLNEKWAQERELQLGEQRQRNELERVRRLEAQAAEVAAREQVAQHPVGKSRNQIRAAVGVALVCLASLISWGRNIELRRALERCDSLGVVEADAYYRGYFAINDIVFDFQTEGGESGARRIDAVHLLMQFASRCESYSVDRFYLARDGAEIFIVNADDMRALSGSYGGGGRVWAFNNLPSRTRYLDGSGAYSEWSGGWIGVVKEQAEDLNDFIREWTGY